MKRRYPSSFLLLLSLFVAVPSLAQDPVRINWTAVTGAQSGMFMAQQEGLFKKNGIHVELIHIPSSSRGIPYRYPTSLASASPTTAKRSSV